MARRLQENRAEQFVLKTGISFTACDVHEAIRKHEERTAAPIALSELRELMQRRTIELIHTLQAQAARPPYIAAPY